MSKLSQTKVSVLNKFESKTDEWSFGEFEKALETAMGSRYGNYQTSKMTIKEADSAGKWPNTVKRYVLHNYKVMGNSPSELVSICNRLVTAMTEAEKKSWGFVVEA
jgi:hypothetical protein